MTITHSMASSSATQRVPRSVFLPFHVPHIDEEEIQAVVRTLQSGWLTTGRQASEFERLFAEMTGSRYAVAVNSATAALHLALDAIGLTAGDEVLVPTMTFAATAEVVTYFGARPVLVDCQADTLNIDVEHAREVLTSRCRAIIPVHFAGHPCDMAELGELANEHGLKVIEDAAHALPAWYRGQLAGTIGDIACFSFYATKTITTGEGGMILTDDADYADRMRIMSLHGISRTAWNRYSREGSWWYEILRPGYKYNLSDVAAALGIEQLKKYRRFWEARSHIAARYDAGFADVQAITVPARRHDVEHSWHLYVIRLNAENLTIDRAEFIEALKREQIGASVHFIPLHLHPYYRDTWGYREDDMPRASAAYRQIVSLPIYPNMSDEDVDDVIHAVRKIVASSTR